MLQQCSSPHPWQFRPSVRLSQASAVTKRNKLRSRDLHRLIAHHPTFLRGEVHLKIRTVQDGIVLNKSAGLLRRDWYTRE